MVELADYIFKDQSQLTPIELMKEQIKKFSPRDISSIMSYFAWEQEFLEVMHD